MKKLPNDFEDALLIVAQRYIGNISFVDVDGLERVFPQFTINLSQGMNGERYVNGYEVKGSTYDRVRYQLLGKD